MEGASKTNSKYEKRELGGNMLLSNWNCLHQCVFIVFNAQRCRYNLRWISIDRPQMELRFQDPGESGTGMWIHIYFPKILVLECLLPTKNSQGKKLTNQAERSS